MGRLLARRISRGGMVLAAASVVERFRSHIVCYARGLRARSLGRVELAVVARECMHAGGEEMANRNVDAFIRAAETDPPLADALLNASGLDELVTMGAARGYDFTKDELTSYLGSGSDELDEAQLAGVGGGSGQPVCYLKYKLDRCFVKSWSTSGDAD